MTANSTARSTGSSTGTGTALVDLLGDTRARIVDLLRRDPSSVAALADRLDLSEVAVRRHLQVLERDGFVRAETVRRDGPGRPSAQYGLTDRADRLYPDNSAELANELFEYLEENYGRRALVGFLRWRQDRQGQRYAAAMAERRPADGTEAVGALAELLSLDGFASEAAEVDGPDGRPVIELRQRHCTVKDVAAEHPELCAYEAALFQQLVGGTLSRRQTIADGAGECICHIAPTDAPPPADPQDDSRDARGPIDDRPHSGEHDGHEG